MSPAEPVVLVAGMNCSARLWPRLSGLATVHAGLEEPTLDSCVEALLARLPERFALVGLSLGGIVAMALARIAPGRLTRLALLSTNARPPSTEQRAGWTAQRAALAGGASSRDLQRDLLPLLLHERTPARDERVLAMADEVGGGLLDRQLRLQATRIDERPGLAAIAVPTLVLSAARDRLCPVERHREIASLVPGAELVVLDGVGHLSPVEAPDRVAEVLGDWLSGLPSSSSHIRILE